MLERIVPRHIAITMNGNLSYSKKHKIPIDRLYFSVFHKINEMIDFQVKNNIPVMTLFLLTNKAKTFDNFPNVMDALVDFFQKLKDNKIVQENMVKISILGKWYDMPGRVVEPIKAVMDATRDYDTFFLNLCINYDGREEIVDACKIIGRRIQAGKLDLEQVDEESIKDSLYSSYFLPPDIIIKTGFERSLKGFMLWDSPDSHVYFSNTAWPELTRDDIKRAIEDWKRIKIMQEDH